MHISKARKLKNLKGVEQKLGCVMCMQPTLVISSFADWYILCSES